MKRGIGKKIISAGRLVLVAAFAVGSMATSVNAQEAKISGKLTTVQTNKKISDFLNKITTAKSLEEVSTAFKNAKFSASELKILQKETEKPEYSQKLDGLTSKARADYSAAAAQSEEADRNQIAQKQEAFVQKRSGSLMELNNLAQSNFTKLETGEIQVKKTGKRTVKTIRMTPSMRMSLGQTTGAGPAARIFSVSPTPLVVGGSLTISGNEFGNSRGTVDLVIGEDLIHCNVTAWGQSSIAAGIPAYIQDLVGEREKDCIVWVKMRNNMGPTFDTHIGPDVTQLVPVITYASNPTIRPGQRFVFHGDNFLDSPGSVSFHFADGAVYEAYIRTWRNDGMLFDMNADITGRRAEDIDIVVTNRLGNSVEYRIRFTPVEEFVVLSEYHGISFRFLFGDRYMANHYNFELINDWKVEEAWITSDGGGLGYGAVYDDETVHRYGRNRDGRPIVGTRDPWSRIIYWADAFSWVSCRVKVAIAGPKGLPYKSD